MKRLQPALELLYSVRVHLGCRVVIRGARSVSVPGRLRRGVLARRRRLLDLRGLLLGGGLLGFGFARHAADRAGAALINHGSRLRVSLEFRLRKLFFLGRRRVGLDGLCHQIFRRRDPIDRLGFGVYRFALLFHALRLRRGLFRYGRPFAFATESRFFGLRALESSIVGARHRLRHGVRMTLRLLWQFFESFDELGTGRKPLVALFLERVVKNRLELHRQPETPPVQGKNRLVVDDAQ